MQTRKPSALSVTPCDTNQSIFRKCTGGCHKEGVACGIFHLLNLPSLWRVLVWFMPARAPPHVVHAIFGSAGAKVLINQRRGGRERTGRDGVQISGSLVRAPGTIFHRGNGYEF